MDVDGDRPSRSRSCCANPRRSASPIAGVASVATRRFDDQPRSRGWSPGTDSITRWLSPPMVESPLARASVSNNKVLPARGDDTTNTGRSMRGADTARATGDDSASRSTATRSACWRMPSITCTPFGSRASPAAATRAASPASRSTVKWARPSGASPKRAHAERQARTSSTTGWSSAAATTGSDPSSSASSRSRACSSSHGVITDGWFTRSVTSVGSGLSIATTSGAASGWSMRCHKPALPTVSTTRWMRGSARRVHDPVRTPGVEDPRFARGHVHLFAGTLEAHVGRRAHGEVHAQVVAPVVVRVDVGGELALLLDAHEPGTADDRIE